MERGIETQHLPHGGKPRRHGSHEPELRRQMQAVERQVSLEIGQELRIDRCGLGMFGAAEHDAVSDRKGKCESCRSASGYDALEQRARLRRTVRQRPVMPNRGRVFSPKLRRRGANILRRAAEKPPLVRVIRTVNGELERRRARVQTEDVHRPLFCAARQRQSRISGKSSPTCRMYVACSTSLSRMSCWTWAARSWNSGSLSITSAA